MLLCYRVGFLKLRLQFHMGFVPVHLRGGQGRNTAHPGGSKGKAQRGLLSVHFLCLDHQHHFPNQLCLDLLKHIGSTHRKAKITAFTFRAQRGIWKVNFAFWPTGLRVTLLASCWRAAGWPHRICWGDERAPSSPYLWIDSAAFATSKPLRHSRGAPSPLKPYPFHTNFYK